MRTTANSLDRLYVAAPCPADWEKMEGDDNVRFCAQCRSNVYNLSVLSKRQAETLIINTEGRLCTKFYRRADGTIRTKDCPVGVSAIKRRVARVAGAALSTVLSLVAGIGLRNPIYAVEHQDGGTIKIKRAKLESRTGRSALQGTVFDITQAVIPDAAITITNEGSGETYTARTSDDGQFFFYELEAGSYTITVASPGFVMFTKKRLKLGSKEPSELEVTLRVGTVGGAAFLPEKHRSVSLPV